MADTEKPHSLEELLDQIEVTDESPDDISVGWVLDAMGHRSFGAVLTFAGIIVVMPIIGDIPGVPVIIGVIVFIVAAQLLIARDHLWLPGFLLNLSVRRKRMSKVLDKLQHSSEVVDRFLKKRLQVFTGAIGRRFIASACMVVAVALVPMELIPFSATGGGLALTGFGLALISRDGLLAQLSLMITAVSIIFIIYTII